MLKAVIIDDDVTTLNGLTKTVDWKKLNIEVAGTAQNGQAGLELIEAEQPDIIVTDIYMPVMDGIEMLKQLRGKHNSAEVIILSGYEDFKYAQSALKLNVRDYLNKPITIDEIEGVLTAAAQKVTERSRIEKEDKEVRELLDFNLPLTKKQLFKELLQPDQVQYSYMFKVMEHMQIDLTNSYFSVICIDFLRDRERLDCKPSEWALFSYAVNNIVEEMIGSKRGVYIADMQLNMVTVIVSAAKPVKKETVEKQVRKIADELLHNIGKFLKIHVWAAIGSPVDYAEQIHLSYKEAMNLQAQRHQLTDKRIITKEDAGENQRMAGRRPMESYHSIVDAAVQGQGELVDKHVESFLEVLHTRSDISIGLLREFAVDFMGVLVVALYDHGLHMEDGRSDFNAYKEMEWICGREDFTVWMKDLLQSVSRLMDKRVSSKHKKTIDFIIRFVQAHYAEDITLDIIAEKVYLTRNYLSQIFKQDTGENYNNYLTRVRMEKAKDLMLTGNYKLYEISQMVGYKNNAYFSQLFKKYTGYNPSEFNQ